MHTVQNQTTAGNDIVGARGGKERRREREGREHAKYGFHAGGQEENSTGLGKETEIVVDERDIGIGRA